MGFAKNVMILNPDGMDELTAKDKERIQKEADEEIELNFPSYFDEF